MRLVAALAILAPTAALAGSWEPGALQPLEVGIPVHTAAVGTWKDQPVVVLAGPEKIRIVSAEGSVLAESETSIADLVVEDLDTDGTPELVACSSTGLAVLRAGASGFGEPIQLSKEPCSAIVAFEGAKFASLATLSGGAVKIWSPGGEGLVSSPFEGPTKPRALVAAGKRFAVVGDTVVTGPEPAPLATDGEVLAVGPDGDGWAIVYGGEPNVLALADGTQVPLPGAPTWVSRLPLAGPDDLVVGLGGASVAIRVGDAPLEVTELPVEADIVGAGDLDGDGCADLVAVAADGSGGSIVKGVCSGPKVAAGDLPLAVPVDADPGADLTQTGGELVLGEKWQQLDLRAGRLIEKQLVDGVNGWDRFASRGGPEGFTLTTSGQLSYRPTDKQVGLWRVAVLATDGTQERWTGIVLRIEPAMVAKTAPVADPAVTVVPEPEPERDADDIVKSGTVRDTVEPGPFTIRECLVGAGVAGGLSRNTQSSWSNVGLPDTVPSGSAAVTMTCSGGAQRHGWFLGADSAPTFFYLARNGRQNHVLAATLGYAWTPGAVRIGPYVNAGLVVFGFGLRAAVVPFETKRGAKHGVEMRFTTYPANLSGQAMLNYTWEFGDF